MNLAEISQFFTEISLSHDLNIVLLESQNWEYSGGGY